MRFLSGSLFAVLITLSLVAHASATEVHAKETNALTQLMQAISQKDYAAFVSNGNSDFKTGITESIFNSVEKQLGNLIRDGYKTEYLSELNQQGKKVHLWKISYEKSSENTLAKLIIVEAKVAGFWLQ